MTSHLPAPGRLAILWICGASGAGKSAAAWELVVQLAAADVPVAYVDIDQLGMLHPAASGDPLWHHELKAAALEALLPGWIDAGVRVLVVSGVVDPHRGPVLQLPPDVGLTLCLLVPDPAVLREGIVARGWGEGAADEALAEHDVLRAASFPHVRLETVALSVAETVARLRTLIPVEVDVHRPLAGGRVSAAATDVVLVTGPRVAGSSTVGFGLAVRRWRAGRMTAFLDLQQLGFRATGGRVVSDAALAIDRLAVLHEFMAGRGAELLVVTGHVTVADRVHVLEALAAAGVTIVRLWADERTLTEHATARVAGSDARLAGDDLLGADREHQRAVVAAALAEQQILDAGGTDDVGIDVSGRAPAEVIAELERRMG